MISIREGGQVLTACADSECQIQDLWHKEKQEHTSFEIVNVLKKHYFLFYFVLNCSVLFMRFDV